MGIVLCDVQGRKVLQKQRRLLGGAADCQLPCTCPPFMPA